MLRCYVSFASCYRPPGSSAGVRGFSETFERVIAGLAAGRAQGQGNGGLYAIPWRQYDRIRRIYATEWRQYTEKE